MHKKLLRTLTLSSAVFCATSCGLDFAPWDWLSATNNNTQINYCLLIGQNDHSDSIERTRATRKAFNTLDESEETKKRTNNNPNLAEPIPGHVDFVDKNGNNVTIPVTEIEHAEQKSLSGVTWDTITASNSASVWCAKHGKNITMFVSNNDGMAEGAALCANMKKGMPIFGYDANKTTLQMIDKGYMRGTVSQNSQAQTAAALLLARNICDFLAKNPNGHIGNNLNNDIYNPLKDGFMTWSDATANPNGYGQINDDINFDGCDLTATGDQAKALLLRSIPVDERNIDEYVDPKTHEAKGPSDIYLKTVTKPSTPGPAGQIPVFLCYNNATEVFLNVNMKPFFGIYNDIFDLKIDDSFQGDGITESLLTEKITMAKEKFGAYLINMVKTSDAELFVTTVAEKVCSNFGKPFSSTGWEKWEDRLNVPLIFWNKQPLTADGANVDYKSMQNKFFKYTYYVGVDAAYGGTVQGDMIVNFIKTQYNNTLEEQEGK